MERSDTRIYTPQFVKLAVCDLKGVDVFEQFSKCLSFRNVWNPNTFWGVVLKRQD